MKKKTRYVILGLLRDEPMTGYELKSCIDVRMAFFWNESYGQIYPELTQLAEEGLIEYCEEEKADNRGKIRYSITQRGHEVFNKWMKEDYEKETVRSEALLKFFLADDDNKEDIIKHLEKFYNSNKAQLDMFEKFLESMKGFEHAHNHSYIIHMLELGMRQQQLYCEWSESYMKELTQE